MSTLTDPQNVPRTARPGWGIAADLLPREVLQERRVRVVRRMVGLGLLVLLLACVGLVLLSAAERTDAQRAYDEAQTDTGRLRADAAEYADITAATTLIEDGDAQAARLLATDIDVVDLLSRIRAALPPGVTISNIAVQQTGADSTADTTAGTASEARTVIGTLTISGGGPAIRDLAPFVAALNHLEGLADVVPGSTTQSDDGMTYSLSASLTDALYTGRFATGGAQ